MKPAAVVTGRFSSTAIPGLPPPPKGEQADRVGDPAHDAEKTVHTGVAGPRNLDYPADDGDHAHSQPHDRRGVPVKAPLALVTADTDDGGDIA